MRCCGSAHPGVQAQPSPESGFAQQKLLLSNRSSFCSTEEATSAQQKLLLFSRRSFCSPEAPSVQEKRFLSRNRRRYTRSTPRPLEKSCSYFAGFFEGSLIEGSCCVHTPDW